MIDLFIVTLWAMTALSLVLGAMAIVGGGQMLLRVHAIYGAVVILCCASLGVFMAWPLGNGAPY